MREVLKQDRVVQVGERAGVAPRLIPFGIGGSDDEAADAVRTIRRLRMRQTARRFDAHR
jgi:hypothetical protein